MKKYKHSFANYPQIFHGTVISPHKICLQFKDVKTTLRVAYHDTSDLIKLPTTEKGLPVVPHGVGIDILAVGCEFPVLEKLQLDLIDSYIDYYKQHKDRYKQLYNKDFAEFVLAMQYKLAQLIKVL